MKAMMLIEDRDEGYLFLDTENAPEGASMIEVFLDDDVRWNDVSDEERVVWLVHELDTARLRVASVDEFGFDLGFDGPWFPVPTPVILMDKNEYERCFF